MLYNYLIFLFIIPHFYLQSLSPMAELYGTYA